MVSGNDCTIAMFPAQVTKPPVAQFACCHFYAQPVFRSILYGIKGCLVKFHAMRPGPLGDKRFIGITVLSPEIEVAMSDGAPFHTERPHPHISQTHGIHASADSKEERGRSFDQPLHFLYNMSEAVKHYFLLAIV